MMESAKKWRGHNATNGMYCSRDRRVVRTENLNPEVVVMESAEDGERF
jgi:hypothetical protein